MIKEIFEYISEGFYQKKDAEIAQAFDDYEKGLSLEGEESEALKEGARKVLEAQLVKSGQMEEETVFINPDEFFPDGLRDQDMIDDFRRNMTLSHGGQQVLWSFAGTTGAMTVITERHLESMGRSLDKLKPAGMLREERKKRAEKNAVPPNTVRLYLYGDGTASEEYDKEKAKIRYDRCKDTSGFDWNLEKYDPNYKVEKKGWFGAFNEEGEWVRVDIETDEEKEDVVVASTPPEKDIKLIYTLDGPLIFDAALLLAQEEEEYYYTMSGDLYGAVKTDSEETLKTLKEEMHGAEPAGIVLPSNASKKVKDLYKEKLGNNVQFYEDGSEEVTTLLETDSELRKDLAGASLSLAAVTRLQRKGLSREKAADLLNKTGNEIPIPLNPFAEEDRREIAPELSREASSWLNEKEAELGGEELRHAIPFIAAVLPLLTSASASSGLNETDVLDKALDLAKGGDSQTVSSMAMMTGRITLSELVEGKHPWKSSTPNEIPYDFFKDTELKQAAKAAGLKEGETASLKEAVKTLMMGPADQKRLNEKLTNAVKEYRAIQKSTGMTAGDLVRTVESISMKRPRLHGRATQRSEVTSPDAKQLGLKQVYFEASLHDVLTDAASRPAPTKTIDRDELFRPLDFGEKYISASGVIQKEGTESIQADPQETLEPLTPEVALTMTETLLAALAVPTEGAAGLSEEQLTGVEELYSKAKMAPETTGQVMNQWKAKKFTPEEYDIVRERLEKKLTVPIKAKKATGKPESQSEDPIIREILSALPSSKGKIKKYPQREQHDIVVNALSGQWEKVPQEIRQDLSDAILKGSGISLSVYPESDTKGEWTSISPSSRIVKEDSRIVEAVAEAFYDENVLPEPALDQKVLLPLIAQAVNGNWKNVPEEIMPNLTRAVRRRGKASSLLPSVSSSSSKAPSRRVKAQNKRMPIEVPVSDFKGKGYSSIGYQVVPQKRQVTAVKKEAAGNRIEGLDFSTVGNGMIAMRTAKAPGTSFRTASGKTKSTTSNSQTARNRTAPQKERFKAPTRLNIIPSGTAKKSLNHVPERKNDVVKAVMAPSFEEEWTPETLPHATGLGGPAQLGGHSPSGPPNIQQFNNIPQGQFAGQQQQSMSRMDRINANYEVDRASMGNRVPSGERMLARSGSRSVGHAGGESEQRKKYKTIDTDGVMDDIKEV